MKGPATFGDIFVHRRCLEIGDLLSGDVTASTIEDALRHMHELDAMRLSRESMEAYEAEHGRSAPVVNQRRARIDANYDQTLAIRELRSALEAKLREVAVA